jgi:hypothetical protein
MAFARVPDLGMMAVPLPPAMRVEYCGWWGWAERRVQPAVLVHYDRMRAAPWPAMVAGPVQALAAACVSLRGDQPLSAIKYWHQPVTDQ